MRSENMKSDKCRQLNVYLILIIVSTALLLPGCVGKRKPSQYIEQYTLEYQSPEVKDISQINEAIRLERFSVARAFNSRDMVYSPSPYKQDAYRYHRWRVNPGDMVTDYLIRDLRDAGLFMAVFSYRGTEVARYILDGGVIEFLEVGESGGRKAVLSLSVTLMDTKEQELPERLVFQKRYRVEEPITEKTPAGFAEAMSRAMEKFSSKLITDLCNEITNGWH